MGALSSRQHAGVEEVDIVSNHAYKYPPRSGNYFGSHFIMGGERFDTPQPEAYLFGENADLNFLGSRPTPFPYPPPQANEPTKTLKSLVNIRKESLRFVKSPDAISKIDADVESAKSSQFNIEFTFDCDARCAITIYYFCSEEFTSNGVVYSPRDPTMNSETYLYKRGANQQFCQVSHTFDPSLYTDEDLIYNPDRDLIPIAIHCVAEENPEDLLAEHRQSHTTIAVVERHLDGSYMLKALKQKLYVDGLCYLLQEIYGIENKNNDTSKTGGDEDTEDNGSECVICMCDVRDTLILPCRHLCLCNSCADSLRYQANNCPICRAPFRALLQIRALQKSSSIAPAAVIPPEASCENIPAGYEAVSLLEALNGPCPTRPVAPPPPPSANIPHHELAETPEHPETPEQQAADALNRSNLERNPGPLKSPNATSSPPNDGCSTPEFRMSVLLSREEEQNKEPLSSIPVASSTPSATHVASPLLVRHLPGGRPRDKATVLRPRDTVRLVNEKTSSSSPSTAPVNEVINLPPYAHNKPHIPKNYYTHLPKHSMHALYSLIQGADDDSEAEKLSPLLDAATNTDDGPQRRLTRRSRPTVDDDEDEDEDDSTQQTDSAESAVTAPLTAHVHSARGGVEANQPVSDSCHVATTLSAAGGGDDSDYYTPEDPPVLSPLHHTDKVMMH